MATKTVILVLAVLAAAVAIAMAGTTKRAAPNSATFIVPYYRIQPNGQKTIELLNNIVTPVVSATNQALLFTGQLVTTAIGGLTNALSVIEGVLTGSGSTTTTTTTTPAPGK